ncbi:MAG TPA: peptidase C39 family protein [Nocardioidaceae bacterium]|nr:peptidase C39 family protein [Nocardioidaceae bacterium]
MTSPSPAAPATSRDVRLSRRTPEFDLEAMPEPFEYVDPFGDLSARTYERLTWTSAPIDLGVAAHSVVASWEARTPGRTWIELSVRGTDPETPWLVLARWAETDVEIHRTTVPGQKSDAYAVTDDEIVIPDDHRWRQAQVRVALVRPQGSDDWPSVTDVTLLASTRLVDETDAMSQPSGIAHAIDVPAYSQQLYRDQRPELGGGGQNWCSPTSMTMVLEHWGTRLPADPAVPYAAEHTYDHNYGGAGNWPFNTAYAARFGLTAYVTRLRSLAEAERFTRAGIPLVLGVAFDADQLDGAGYETKGHLLVLIGFDENGDPIVNDPASHRERSNEAVRTTYRRDQFLKAWQVRASGVAYVVHPRDYPVPPCEDEVDA